jgi:hypothetical protein
MSSFERHPTLDIESEFKDRSLWRQAKGSSNRGLDLPYIRFANFQQYSDRFETRFLSHHLRNQLRRLYCNRVVGGQESLLSEQGDRDTRR